MRFLKLTLVLSLLIGIQNFCTAQKVALKTNLLTDFVALSPNIGAEFGLKPNWTLDVSGEINFWTVNKHKWKHWFLSPEARYWFCERFAGHFLGFHALVGEFNAGNIKNNFKLFNNDFSPLTDKRYQGWGAGLGVAYGYSWILSDHWNIEAEIGLGWIHTRYDVFPCTECGEKLESGQVHNYFGPTKLAVALEYLF